MVIYLRMNQDQGTNGESVYGDWNYSLTHTAGARVAAQIMQFICPIFNSGLFIFHLYKSWKQNKTLSTISYGSRMGNGKIYKLSIFTMFLYSAYGFAPIINSFGISVGHISCESFMNVIYGALILCLQEYAISIWHSF